MVMEDHRNPIVPRRKSAAHLASAIALFCGLAEFSHAKDYANRFVGEKTSWQIAAGRNVRITAHRRIGPKGDPRRYEHVQFEVDGRGAELRWEHALPPARVFDELKLSLLWNSTRGVAAVFLRVVFPRHTDPRTRRPLTTLIAGDRYTKIGKWQQLNAGVTQRQIQSRLRELREKLRDPLISSDGMYVSGVVVALQTGRGTVHAGVSQMNFGPLVSPGNAKKSVPSERGLLKQRSVTRAVEFRLDRMHVAGRPFFPRIVAYHRESPQFLQNAGFNVVWVPRYDDEKLARSLRQHNLWLTATPPSRPLMQKNSHGATKSSYSFGRESSPVLFWNIGTRIPPSARKKLVDWVERIHRADRHFDRPILGDVTGNERIFSRHISMLGASRHVLHTTFTLKQYRDWLIQKGNLARAGTFRWTWVQTEPSDEHDGPTGRNAVIEPEQIRLQVYAALAAGCRGIGYWKMHSLTSKTPGAEERRLIVAQLNHELDLLTPWTSTGTIVDHKSFRVDEPNGSPIGRGRLDFARDDRRQRESLLKARQDRLTSSRERGAELEATIIRSESGTLVLPIWYGANAQFVPGKLAANNARVLVHGIPRPASAYLVTTTNVRSLVQKRVTGGLEVVIPRFDQTAAVVITSKRELIEQLRARMMKIAPVSAKILVQLAAAKLERVSRVHGELAKLGRKSSDAPQLLRKANSHADLARAALDRNDYATAQRESDNALQLLRILQRIHWNDAVRGLTSPVASPYAVCFQSLPEHWKLLARLGRSSPGRRKLLRSGDFEDIDTMVSEGWQHTQTTDESLRAVAELYPKGKTGSYSLRLVAAPVPKKERPTYVPRPTVTVKSPKLTVLSGQIVRISGWVKLAVPTVGHPDGALLYDSIDGLPGAIRWRKQTGWQRFVVLREVRRSGPMQLTMVLHGMGEVRFDELRVEAFDLQAGTSRPGENPKPAARDGFRLIPKLPKLPSLPNWYRR